MSRTYTRTHHGLKQDFMNLQPSMVRAHDMAWHLGRTCRYVAMTHQWYSNAEHSFLGMQFCTSHEAKRQFLVHDVGEMITGDVPSPVKRLCPDYKALADKIQGDFNFILFGSREFLPEVLEADARITATEMVLLRGQPEEDMWAEPEPKFHFPCWGWNVAMFNWMTAFKRYFPEYPH